jgi:predicted nucleotidyltransferase
LAIEFENDELYAACKAVEPFLDRLVLVGGWAFRALMNIWRDEDRMTKDADFAIQLVSRESFDEIANYLLSQGFHQRQVSKRFKRKEVVPYSFEKKEQRIEIMPFGKASGDIIPLDLKEYRLAFEDNLGLKVISSMGEQMQLKVVNTPSFVVMKLFSLTDRWHERQKDLSDIEYILNQYGVEVEKYGLITKYKQVMDEEIVAYELASAHLLGREIQNRLQDELFIEAGKRLALIVERLRNFEHEETERTKRFKILLDYFLGNYQ